ITWMFVNLCRLLREKVGVDWEPAVDSSLKEPRATVLIPGNRIRYLAEIAEQGRAINQRIESQADLADRAQSLWQALQDLEDAALPARLELYPQEALLPEGPSSGASRHLLPASGEKEQHIPSPRDSGEKVPEGRMRGAVDQTLLTLRQRYNDAIQSLD